MPADPRGIYTRGAELARAVAYQDQAHASCVSYAGQLLDDLALLRPDDRAHVLVAWLDSAASHGRSLRGAAARPTPRPARESEPS